MMMHGLEQLGYIRTYKCFHVPSAFARLHDASFLKYAQRVSYYLLLDLRQAFLPPHCTQPLYNVLPLLTKVIDYKVDVVFLSRLCRVEFCDVWF